METFATVLFFGLLLLFLIKGYKLIIAGLIFFGLCKLFIVLQEPNVSGGKVVWTVLLLVLVAIIWAYRIRHRGESTNVQKPDKDQALMFAAFAVFAGFFIINGIMKEALGFDLKFFLVKKAPILIKLLGP